MNALLFLAGLVLAIVAAALLGGVAGALIACSVACFVLSIVRERNLRQIRATSREVSNR